MFTMSTLTAYRYGFNGKEKDSETSSDDYDFGARIYDARLGRWLGCDPQFGKYSSWSPYHFGFCNPIVTIDPDGEENIVLVGAENHDKSPGNKLMFMLQAIRQVRKYKDISGEATTILLFNHGYTEKQIKAFERIAKIYGVKNVIQVANVDEVVNYVNSKDIKTKGISDARKSDKVSNMDAFSHGLPGQIDFDFEGGQSNTALTVDKVNDLDKNAFGIDPSTGEAPIFISYACRTGTPDEAGNNLAQSFADKTGVKVRAFKRRSNYEDTFGTEAIRTFNRSVRLDNIIPGLGTCCLIKAWGINKYNSIKKISESLDDPSKRYKIDGALFDERGAFGGVKSGNSPGNLPSGQFEFTSKIKPEKK